MQTNEGQKVFLLEKSFFDQHIIHHFTLNLETKLYECEQVVALSHIDNMDVLFLTTLDSQPCILRISPEAWDICFHLLEDDEWSHSVENPFGPYEIKGRNII